MRHWIRPPIRRRRNDEIDHSISEGQSKGLTLQSKATDRSATRLVQISVNSLKIFFTVFFVFGSTIASAKKGHAPVNGIQMYYELHFGDHETVGTPLLLLHGGGSTIEVTFGKVLPLFARKRVVMAVEEQGHGRTSDRNAPVRFETSADDVAALLKHLNIPKVDVFGFSNGASVGLQLAIRHPGLVRKLVFASSMTKKSGAHAQFWKWMKEADFSNMPQPLKDAFLKVNPDPKKLKTMHDKDAERMRGFQDVPDAKVRGVGAPTLVLIGDKDLVKPEHAASLARLFPNGRLLIVPGAHGDYIGELVMTTQTASRMPELTVGLVEEFLDAPTSSLPPKTSIPSIAGE